MKKINVFLIIILSLICVPLFAGTIGTGQETSESLNKFLLVLGIIGYVVGASAYDAVNVAVKTLFNKAYENTQVVYPKIAMEIPSDVEQVDYDWLVENAGIREFSDERQVFPEKILNWTIKDKEWEITKAIPRKAIDDDRYGIYGSRFSRMGALSKLHPDKLVFDTLINGFTTNGYDGTTFFSTTHASGSNRTANAFSEANFASAINLILSQKNELNSEPFFDTGIINFKVIHGPKILLDVRKVLNAGLVPSGGGTNVLYGIAEPVMSPRLIGAYDDYWFVVAEYIGLLPMLYQNRGIHELVMLADVKTKQSAQDIIIEGQNPELFWNKRAVWGTYARYNVGYGLHQLAYGSIL